MIFSGGRANWLCRVHDTGDGDDLFDRVLTYSAIPCCAADADGRVSDPSCPGHRVAVFTGAAAAGRLRLVSFSMRSPSVGQRARRRRADRRRRGRLSAAATPPVAMTTNPIEVSNGGRDQGKMTYYGTSGQRSTHFVKSSISCKCKYFIYDVDNNLYIACSYHLFYVECLLAFLC